MEVKFEFFGCVSNPVLSYVNIYESGASSGGTSVFGKKASKKPRGNGEGERDEDGEASRKPTIPRAGS